MASPFNILSRLNILTHPPNVSRNQAASLFSSRYPRESHRNSCIDKLQASLATTGRRSLGMLSISSLRSKVSLTSSINTVDRGTAFCCIHRRVDHGYQLWQERPVSEAAQQKHCPVCRFVVASERSIPVHASLRLEDWYRRDFTCSAEPTPAREREGFFKPNGANTTINLSNQHLTHRVVFEQVGLYDQGVGSAGHAVTSSRSCSTSRSYEAGCLTVMLASQARAHPSKQRNLTP